MAKGKAFLKHTPLCVIFAKKLEAKVHYEDEIAETEEEFLNK
jgi:hypothetical protein